MTPAGSRPRTKGTLHRLSVFLFCLLAGCGGGGGRPVEAIDPASLPLKPVTAPRFVAGGGADDLALLCADGLHPLEKDGALASGAPRPAWDILARHTAEGGVERIVVRGPAGPVLVEGDNAYALPGWPQGAEVAAAGFSPDGLHLAAAPGGPVVSESVLVWKFPPALAVTLPKDDGGAVTHLTWSADGRTLMTADDTNRLVIYRVPTKRPVYKEDVDRAVDGAITAIALSPDGSWFIAAANAIKVRAWKLPFMNTQLKAWGRVRAVFFAGSVESAVTIDESDSAIRWHINHGNVKAGESRQIEEMTAVGVPAGGGRFHALDAAGNILSFDALTMEPLTGSPAAGCSGRVEEAEPVEEESPAEKL